jgi:hypothetical protein
MVKNRHFIAFSLIRILLSWGEWWVVGFNPTVGGGELPRPLEEYFLFSVSFCPPLLYSDQWFIRGARSGVVVEAGRGIDFL